MSGSQASAIFIGFVFVISIGLVSIVDLAVAFTTIDLAAIITEKPSHASSTTVAPLLSLTLTVVTIAVTTGIIAITVTSIITVIMTVVTIVDTVTAVFTAVTTAAPFGTLTGLDSFGQGRIRLGLVWRARGLAGIAVTARGCFELVFVLTLR